MVAAVLAESRADAPSAVYAEEVDGGTALICPPERGLIVDPTL